MSTTKCINYAFCQAGNVPSIVLSSNDGRCTECDIVFGMDLKIITTEKEEECPVCMKETKDFVEWPDCSEAHKYCFGCSKNFFYGPLFVTGSIYASVEEGECEVRDCERAIKNCPLCQIEV
jgi:hypothetical protein